MSASLFFHSDRQQASEIKHFRSVGRMTNLLLRLAILGCGALAVGCRTRQPVKREALVGTYIYQSQDPEDRKTDHNLDRLTLQSDGSTIHSGWLYKTDGRNDWKLGAVAWA